MDEAKRLFARFDEIYSRSAGVNRSIDSEEERNGRDDNLELLAKMMSVLKAHASGDDEDLLESLRVVREDVRGDASRNEAMNVFAETFVHMATHMLEVSSERRTAAPVDPAASQASSSSSISYPSTMSTSRRRTASESSSLSSWTDVKPSRRRTRGAESTKTSDLRPQRKSAVEATKQLSRRDDAATNGREERETKRRAATKRLSGAPVEKRGRDEEEIDENEAPHAAAVGETEDAPGSSSRPSRAAKDVARANVKAMLNESRRASTSMTHASRSTAKQSPPPSTASSSSRRLSVRGTHLEQQRANKDMAKEPAHRGRGGAGEQWGCGGLTCTLRFPTASEVYTHMLHEHSLEGAILAKCLDCGRVGTFPDMILHRKHGDENTCGGAHAKLSYWVEEERKREDEMNEEKKEEKKQREITREMGVNTEVLRCCMHVGCPRLREPFPSFEQLQDHYREAHNYRVYYHCPNGECDRTFTQPLEFMRHRGEKCANHIPNIIKRVIDKSKEKEKVEE